MAQIDLTSVLVASNTYRDFLKKAFLELKKQNPRFNYAFFARKAGFSSRSHPKDVAEGYRRMTPAAFAKFSKALGLQGDSKNCFSYLVGLEEPDFQPEIYSKKEILEKLSKVKNRLRARLEMQKGSQISDLYKITHWQEVYAALGTPENGASLGDVTMRTGLSISTCQTSLQRMCEIHLVRLNSELNRYYPKNLHIAFDKLGQDQFFKSGYLDMATALQKDARDNFEKQDRLFFSSAFSIKKTDLPKARKALREVLLQYVADLEDDEGDKIARLVVAISAKGS